LNALKATFQIKDSFQITGWGLVAIGDIISGKIAIGDIVYPGQVYNNIVSSIVIQIF